MAGDAILLALIIPSLAGIVWYAFQIRAVFTGQEKGVSCARFSWPDAIFAGALAAMFLKLIWQEFGKTYPVTLEALYQGIVIDLLIVLIVFGFLVLRWVNPISVFGLWPGSFRAVLVTAGIGLVAIVPVVILLEGLAIRLSGAGASEQEVVIFLRDSTGWGPRLVVILLAVIVAPIAEEVVFRGYFYGVLKRYTGRWIAMGTAALLFAAYHMHLSVIPALFVLAVAFTIAYERTGSLWTTIVMHACFNGIMVGAIILWPHLVA